MGSHIERGYTGPPLPADLCSSGRDRLPGYDAENLEA
jgi:hypothetical protein